MELHSIKEKQSKSKRTGGCPLSGQMKWRIQKVQKGVLQVKEEFCACYKFVKTLNCLWSLIVTMTKWITIVSQWI